MSYGAPARIPSAFTRFPRLLALRDRLAGLFRARRTGPRSARLGVEAMEERLVPDGRPLPYPVIFTGSGAGDAAVVKAFDADTGNLRWTKTVYGSFTGGVRVAAGDITGDGIPDAVIAPGAGHAPRVKVLDGVTGDPIAGGLGSFLAYSSSVDGGVFVASADVDGDGRQDVITAAETSGGPRVKVFSGTDGTVLANFLVSGAAFDDGVTVAAADFTGDGKSEVVVGAGSNGRVKVYDPLTGAVIAGPLGSFRAFGSSYTGSVFVGSDDLAGDVDGDGVSDLVVGTGAGSTARVKVFSGATGSVLYDFEPFGSSFMGGVRVALAFADDDDRADIVVGTGAGVAAQVKVFSGATGAQLASPLGQYAPFGSSEAGVFVGASNDPKGAVMASYVNGSTTVPSLVAGQGFTISVSAQGTVATPTGTVQFTVYATPSFTPLATWTQSLATTTAPTAATAPFALALWGGSFEIDWAYSGDTNYAPAVGVVALSVTGSPIPALAPGVPCPRA